MAKTTHPATIFDSENKERQGCRASDSDKCILGMLSEGKKCALTKADTEKAVLKDKVKK